MKALISVSDKTGIVEFAKELEELGIEIISTGGTYKKLKEEGVKAIEISDLTGFPECLDGRVKNSSSKGTCRNFSYEKQSKTYGAIKTIKCRHNRFCCS